MNVTIIGTGFVGVVTAAVYASFGYEVIGLDVDEKKIESLRHGKVPFFEPNLENLLLEQQAEGHLKFTTDYKEAISSAEIIMIAVGTPSAADGQADLKYVFAAAESLAPHLQPDAIVVVKSTVPPGTLDKVAAKIQPLTKVTFHLASVPEFLKEGSAVHDTLNPDRIVIGARSEFVFEKLEQLHKPLNAEVIKITPESAQMAKYAANSYLATRITFINQMADLCDKNGADIQEVIAAISLDQRIGSHYWYPGFGYGGSCFPKDVKELAAYSRSVGESNNLFNKVSELNEARIDRLMTQFADKVGGWKGKKVAVLGLSFKPNTDDTREAPSLKVIPELIAAGAQVSSYDPRAELPSFMTDTFAAGSYHQLDSIEKTTKDAEVIIALVEWSEIVSFEFGEVKSKSSQFFIDARNQFDPTQIKNWGYTYLGIGR